MNLFLFGKKSSKSFVKRLNIVLLGMIIFLPITQQFEHHMAQIENFVESITSECQLYIYCVMKWKKKLFSNIPIFMLLLVEKKLLKELVMQIYIIFQLYLE